MIQTFVQPRLSNDCHSTQQGRGLLKSHGLSETPIVWRNTSDTCTPRGLRFNSLVWKIKAVLISPFSPCVYPRVCWTMTRLPPPLSCRDLITTIVQPFKRQIGWHERPGTRGQFTRHIGLSYNPTIKKQVKNSSHSRIFLQLKRMRPGRSREMMKENIREYRGKNIAWINLVWYYSLHCVSCKLRKAHKSYSHTPTSHFNTLGLSVAQNLENISENFQFSTRRTRILMGSIISTMLSRGNNHNSHGQNAGTLAKFWK